MGAALVLLVGLTTWAVASVSVWMVPAYLALMVLIFVTPPGVRPSKPASGPGAKPVEVGDVDIDESLTVVDRPAGADHIRPIGDLLEPGLAADEAAIELTGSILDPAGSGGAKPRRGRGRARKAAKAAASSAPDSAAPAATWIRVGPGKFVRADTMIQTVEPAQVEEVGAESIPATDASHPSTTPAPAPAAPTAPSAEQDHLDLLEPTSGDMGMLVRSDESVLGSVTEEYGITPSAFGADPQVTTSSDDLGHDVSGVPAQPAAERVSLASHDGETSRPDTDTDADAGRVWLRRPTSTERSGRVSRGIAGAITGVNPASYRRHARAMHTPRTLVWSPLAPNGRFKQAARRAFGRIHHVQRALRARSPPSRS